MKTYLIKIFGILILAILQLTLLSKFSIFNSIPSLIFILSIALMLRGFIKDSILVAILGGLMVDLASPLRFGVYTLLLISVLFFTNFVIIRSMPVPNLILIYFLFVGFFIFINFIIFLIIQATPSWQILADATINGLWAIIVYLILIKATKQSEEVKFA